MNRIKSRYSFQKIMKNLLFHLKAVKTGNLKAQVGAGAGSGAGAGAEKNSFGSATLAVSFFSYYS
jgi:hypothetical protein